MQWEVSNMKFAVSIFTTLVIIIGTVLFVQYQVYSEKNLSGMNSFEYTQEIEVVYRENSLDIRHHFKNLPNQNIELVLPAKAQAIECFLETGSSCDRLAEGMNTIKAGDVKSQSISYVIPLKEEFKGNIILKDVFASLPKGEAIYSIVHISTSSEIQGQWITGLPLIGQQQLKLVNYAMFSGEGQVKDLYWTSKNTTVQNISDQLTVFSDKPLSANFKEEMSKLELLTDEHFSVVQSSDNVSGHRMLFLPTLSIGALQSNLIITQIEAMYKFEENTPLWIKEMIASFLTGNTLGSSKTEQIVLKITEQMSDSQLKIWKEQLKDLEGQTVNAKVLDEQLSLVINSATNYLEMNSKTETIYPFYNIDSREVLVNSKQIDQMEIIYYEGRVLYKAQPLLEALGYNAYEGENGYYVNNETRVFRFPKEHGFYVFNQRRYETVAKPVVKLQNEYFVEETWLQRLFLIEISKKKSSISIKPVE